MTLLKPRKVVEKVVKKMSTYHFPSFLCNLMHLRVMQILIFKLMC